MVEEPSVKFDAYRNDVDDLLAFEFGSAARVRRLDMPETGPVANVIVGARLSVPTDFCTVWISHSLPEVATYKVSGAPYSIICHSQDHAFYYDQVRWLFDPRMENAVSLNCPYLFHKIIGEFALKYSDTDMAVCIYARAFDNEAIHRPELDRYGTLLPFGGNQLIELVFLLNHLHEMGHDPSFQRRFAALPPDHLLAEAALLDTIHDVLYPSFYPETIKTKVLELARTSEGGYGFSLEGLKEEIVADFHAADGFLRYLQLTGGSAKRDLDLPTLLREYAIYPFLIGVIQRCKLSAQLLSNRSYSKSEKLLRADLQDIAIRVRIFALLQWQHQALHRVVSSRYIGPSHQALVAEMLNDVQRSINRAAVTINAELREVRDHCIELQESSNQARETASCKQRLLNADAVTCLELEEFCKRADSFNKDSLLLKHLKSAIRKAYQ